MCPYMCSYMCPYILAVNVHYMTVCHIILCHMSHHLMSVNVHYMTVLFLLDFFVWILFGFFLFGFVWICLDLFGERERERERDAAAQPLRNQQPTPPLSSLNTCSHIIIHTMSHHQQPTPPLSSLNTLITDPQSVIPIP